LTRIPLFPLNTVLFPNATLPLHIFEERYKLMIGRCIDERAPFGVVLIRSGEEVGETAEPYDVGCTARIARVQRLDDGKLNLICFGERRFRIEALDTSEPYLQGDVTFLDSIGLSTPEAAEHAAVVAGLFGEQYRLVMAVTGQWVREINLPEEPDALADFVAAHIDVPAGAKQELLETLSVPDRLRREADLLGDAIRALNGRWEERRKERLAGAALN
jgi:Lon protease-like protein